MGVGGEIPDEENKIENVVDGVYLKHGKNKYYSNMRIPPFSSFWVAKDTKRAIWFFVGACWWFLPWVLTGLIVELALQTHSKILSIIGILFLYLNAIAGAPQYLIPQFSSWSTNTQVGYFFWFWGLLFLGGYELVKYLTRVRK